MDDYHDPREYAPDDYDVHEDCVSTEDAVRYVFDNHWDLVEEAAGDAKGRFAVACYEDARPRNSKHRFPARPRPHAGRD